MMTVQGLINRVTANLGLRTDQDRDDRPKDPPQPTFHISSKDHFVHPLPGTYPRLTPLSDGSILFAFTHFDESAPGSAPSRSLKIARSIDGGKTFTPHGEVTCSSTGEHDIDNMFLLQLPAAPSATQTPDRLMTTGIEESENQPGAILAAFRNHDFASVNDQSGSKYTHHRITICQSLDNGRKWEFLSQAVESAPPCGLWEPFLRMSKSCPGELQLIYSGELGPDDQDTFLTVSRDWGKSWDPPRAVTGFGEQEDGTSILRDGMVGIAETTDVQGREVLIMVLETTRGDGGSFAVECLASYDDGFSWGSRQSVYVPPGCKRKRRNAGAPQVASFADGEIAVVFMTDEDDDFMTECRSGEDSEVLDRWPLGAKIKVLFGEHPDESGRIVWREGGQPRDVSSSGTAFVEVGSEDGNGNGLVPAPAPGQDTSSCWPGVMRLDGDKLLVVYETGGIIKGRVVVKN